MSDTQEAINSTEVEREANQRVERAERLLLEAERMLSMEADRVGGLRAGLLRQRAWRAAQSLRGWKPTWFSQAGQDKYLDEQVFGGRRKGFFLDVGGYDGVSGSNTLFFELFRDWDGILIEPTPNFFELARQSRRCRCLQTAVAGETGPAEFMFVKSGFRQMSGLTSSYDQSVLEKVRADQRHEEESIKVMTRTLGDILREAGIRHVDYVSLDVEGAEPGILNAFEFDEFDIRAWSIEDNDGDEAIANLMASNGYRRVRCIGSDEIYVK